MLSGYQRQLQLMSDWDFPAQVCESRRKWVRQMMFLFDMATFGFHGIPQYI
jgi:hypothetical protein